jgi:sugar lactone lactonase YvrE
MCGSTCVDPDADGRNCGVCGHDCLGGACSGGVCQPVTLASGQRTPWCIALDSANVYWTNYDGGTVMKVSLDGTTMTTLATGGGIPYGIAVDSTNVYWVDANGNGALWSVPLNGGTGVLLAAGGVRSQYRAVSVDSTRVYWEDEDNPGGIFAASPDGGARTMIARGDYANSTCHLALDRNNVYWLAYPGQDAVDSAPLFGDGGAPKRLASIPSPLGDVWGIASDSTSVYWTQSDTGSVLSVPINGGPVTMLASGSGSPTGIAVDAQRVYWTDEDGAIRSVPLRGGAQITHATGQSLPIDLAVDAKAIYWVTRGGGTVMKVAK